MVIKNIKIITPVIFIPTDTTVYVKITIVADDGVVYTMMDSYGGSEANNHILSPPTITRTSTDTLGTFSFTVANDNGRFLNKFNGGEIVNIYLDRTDATTLYFRGRIDDVKYGVDLSKGFFLSISGRDKPELADSTITGIEAAARADVSLCGILNTKYSDIVLTFWTGTSWSVATYTEATDSVSWSIAVPTFPSTLINMSYQYRSGQSIITDICKRVGLECYVYYNDSSSRWELKTFLTDGIINSTEQISYGNNLLSLPEFGKETSEIYNRVIVYGKTESDNILLLKTEDDIDSQTNLWVKEKIVNESSLETMQQVQDKADYELTLGISATDRGSITSLCLTTLMPGEKILVSVPYCNIDGYYKVQSVTQTIDYILTTSVELSKSSTKVSDLFISKANSEEILSGLDNPNDMKDSYTVYFNEIPEIITRSNTEIIDGKLRLQDGQITGTAITDIRMADYNVTECEFRRYENFETASDLYYVTNDGGTTWEQYNAANGETHSFSSSGRQIGFKIELNRASTSATSPSYESCCLLTK